MQEYEIIEQNLRAAMRFFGEATGTGESCTLERTVNNFSGLDYGVFNISMLTARASTESGGLEAALMESARYYKEKCPRWSFWLCEDLLDNSTRRRARQTFHGFGLRPISHPPGMFAGSLLPPVHKLPAIEIRPVNDGPTRRAFAEITAISFEIPNPIATAVYQPERAWHCGYEGFVAYVNDYPVAIMATVRAGGAVGIYSLGTRPEHRRRGYGEALIRSVIGDEIPVVLQSTEAGYGLYRRMGFRDATRFTVYLTK